MVAFCLLCFLAGMQVLVTAGEQLVEGKTSPKMNSGELTWLIAVMSVAIIAKGALYFYCRSFKSQIVHAYSLVNESWQPIGYIRRLTVNVINTC
jgi:uncharacterized membrane protein YphA (DoxX/SURF4 family)